MNELVIHISWVYFLGIMGSLILVAWYSQGRFTALETSMEWVKDLLKSLKLDADNASGPTPAFAARSPVNLTSTGENWLTESGLKEYIDDKRNGFIALCDEEHKKNPYEVQEYAFGVFDDIEFDTTTEQKLKKFAFDKGTTLGVLRRVGGIYFRNLCLDEFNMKKEDVDKHDPAKKGQAAA